jgi:putative membrane protein
MMDGMGMMMWGILGSVVGLVVIFVFVFAVAMAVKRLWKTNPSGREDALELLKKRYARGEISKDEYEKVKRDIQ